VKQLKRPPASSGRKTSCCGSQLAVGPPDAAEVGPPCPGGRTAATCSRLECCEGRRRKSHSSTSSPSSERCSSSAAEGRLRVPGAGERVLAESTEITCPGSGKPNVCVISWIRVLRRFCYHVRYFHLSVSCWLCSSLLSQWGIWILHVELAKMFCSPASASHR
jgi:hypothetical protein